MTPNQEPVERDIQKDGDYMWMAGAILPAYGVPKKVELEIKSRMRKLLARQKALSRAEVLEEVVELIKENDNKYHAGYYCIEEKLIDSLSDTLAVVDEIKSKEGV